jgi:hypothetical protein
MAKLIAVGLLESGRIGCGPVLLMSAYRPPTVFRANAVYFGGFSACSEPGGSINGSIPGARWQFCKWCREKAQFTGTLQSPLTDSNRRPPPYHGTTRNRCANPPFPWSRPTVSAEVIGSLSTKLCALFRSQQFATKANLPGHCHPAQPHLSRYSVHSGGRHQSAEQYGSSDHRRTAASAARRTAAPSTSTREDGMPRAGHSQLKASGPGGGRGRTR